MSRGLELKTIPHVVATCGENLTLPCEVSASDQLNIISFSWLAKNESMCPHKHGRPDSRAACESATQDHKLTLTLYDVMPVHQGKYFCKVRANHGAKSSTTTVTVQGELQLFLSPTGVFLPRSSLRLSPCSLQTAWGPPASR